MINRSQMSKVVYKASCWDCQDFYIGKTKRRLHDRKTEHFLPLPLPLPPPPLFSHGNSLPLNPTETLATQASTKTASLTPKRYDDHPLLFYIGVPRGFFVALGRAICSHGSLHSSRSYIC